MENKKDIKYLADYLSQYATFATNVDGKPQAVKLDDNLKFICEDSGNGTLIVGFETVDGVTIEEFDGVIPDDVVYTYIKESYLRIK